MHPFFINNYQFVFLSTIFLLLHMLCALLGASCSLVFSFVLLCFLVITSWTLACLLWERHTLHLFLEYSCASLIIVECSILVSSCCFTCLALVFPFYLFKSCYQKLQDSLEFPSYLFRELVFVALVVVSCFEQVIQIAKLSLVISCNSFEVLLEVMSELFCD